MMKKHAKRMLLIALSGALLLLCAGCGMDLDAHHGELSERSASLEGVENLYIYHSEGFQLYDAAIATEYAQDALTVLEYEEEGLRDHGPWLEEVLGGYSYSGYGGHFVWAYMPTSYNGNLFLRAERGDIYVTPALKLHKLTVDCLEGAVLEQAVEAAEISLSGLQKPLQARSLTAETIVLNSYSADILLGRVSGQLAGTTQRGNLVIQDAAISGTFANGRGQTEIWLTELTGDLHLSSESGNILLYLPPDLSCRLTAASPNGTLTLPPDFPPAGLGQPYAHTLGETATYEIKLTSMDGNLKIAWQDPATMPIYDELLQDYYTYLDAYWERAVQEQQEIELQ